MEERNLGERDELSRNLTRTEGELEESRRKTSVRSSVNTIQYNKLYFTSDT